MELETATPKAGYGWGGHESGLKHSGLSVGDRAVTVHHPLWTSARPSHQQSLEAWGGTGWTDGHPRAEWTPGPHGRSHRQRSPAGKTMMGSQPGLGGSGEQHDPRKGEARPGGQWGSLWLLTAEAATLAPRVQAPDQLFPRQDPKEANSALDTTLHGTVVTPRCRLFWERNGVTPGDPEQLSIGTGAQRPACPVLRPPKYAHRVPCSWPRNLIKPLFEIFYPRDN